MPWESAAVLVDKYNSDSSVLSHVWVKFAKTSEKFLKCVCFWERKSWLGQHPSVGVLGTPWAHGAAARASSSPAYQETAERKPNSLTRFKLQKLLSVPKREHNWNSATELINKCRVSTQSPATGFLSPAQPWARLARGNPALLTAFRTTTNSTDPIFHL